VEGLDRLVSQQTATISAQHETIKAALTRIAELEGRMGVMEGNLGSCKNTHHLLSRKVNKLTYEMFALQDGVIDVDARNDNLERSPEERKEDNLGRPLEKASGSGVTSEEKEALGVTMGECIEAWSRVDEVFMTEAELWQAVQDFEPGLAPMRDGGAVDVEGVEENETPIPVPAPSTSRAVVIRDLSSLNM